FSLITIGKMQYASPSTAEISVAQSSMVLPTIARQCKAMSISTVETSHAATREVTTQNKWASGSVSRLNGVSHHSSVRRLRNGLEITMEPNEHFVCHTSISLETGRG